MRAQSLILAIAVAGTAFLVAQDEELVLKHILSEYQRQLELMDQPLVQLAEQYRAALEKLASQAQSRGDLELLLEIKAEQERNALTNRPPPLISEKPPLASVEEIYQKSFARKNEEVKAGKAGAMLNTRRQLEGLVQKLTTEGRIETALAAHNALENLGNFQGSSSPPAFARAMSSEEFMPRWEDFKQEMALEEIKKTTGPGPGYYVTSVTSGEPADTLGIVPGDRILRVEDLELWHQYNMDWGREDESRTLFWQKPDGSIHSGNIPPGKIGIFSFGDLRGEGYYLHNGNRDDKWDDLLLTGILMSDRDPALAQTALFQAGEMGYPYDSVSSAAGLKLSLHQNRPKDAWEYARHILSQNGQDYSQIPRALYPTFAQAALANGKFDILWQSEEATGNILISEFDEVWPAMLEKHKTVRLDWDVDERPSERIPLMEGEDILSKRVLSSTNFLKVQTHHLPRGKGIGEKHSPGAGRYVASYYTFNDGLKNVVWEMDLTLSKAPTTKVTTGSYITAGFLREQEGTKFPEVLLFKIYLNHKVQPRYSVLLGRWNTYFHLNPLPEGEPMRLNLRLIRLGDEMEMQVNGGTVFWGPLPEPADNLGLFFKAGSIDVTFDNYKITKLPDTSAQ